MIELYYDPYLVAYYIVSRDMGSKKMMDFLKKIFVEENEFIHPDFKNNKKAFISDALYWSDYLINKDEFDKEYPVIEKDFKAVGKSFARERYTSEFSGIDMYFAWMRLEILYTPDKDYVRMKLKTLLGHYGYKKRSPVINEKLRDCIMFYHLQPYLKGGEECDIRDIKIDDWITFRIPGKQGVHSSDIVEIEEDESTDHKNGKIEIKPDGYFYLSRWNTSIECEINATMCLKNGRYIVQAGSDFCLDNSESLSSAILSRREAAKIKNGILLKNEEFTSASAAAMFVLGNSENGLTRWKDKNGMSVKEYMLIGGMIATKAEGREKSQFEIAFEQMSDKQQKDVVSIIKEMLGIKA